MHQKGNTTTTKVQRVLVRKSGTLRDLVNELINDFVRPVTKPLTTFLTHLFVAGWQDEQYRYIKRNLPDDQVLMVLYFGQNMAMKFQRAIKSVHWCKGQITIHPIMCYYREDRALTWEAVIFLLDDLGHDHHAAEHFETMTIDHLKSNRGLNFKSVIKFTDGCAGHYKSVNAFIDISCSEDDHGVDVNRNYYGSEHGKGESDGVMGSVKSQVDRAILGKEIVICNAKDCYDYCVQNLGEVKSLHKDDIAAKSLRTFVLVDDIDHNRVEKRTVFKVPGIRKIHNVISTGSSHRVMSRNLSCFCDLCLACDFICI